MQTIADHQGNELAAGDRVLVGGKAPGIVEHQLDSGTHVCVRHTDGPLRGETHAYPAASLHRSTRQGGRRRVAKSDGPIASVVDAALRRHQARPGVHRTDTTGTVVNKSGLSAFEQVVKAAQDKMHGVQKSAALEAMSDRNPTHTQTTYDGSTDGQGVTSDRANRPAASVAFLTEDAAALNEAVNDLRETFFESEGRYPTTEDAEFAAAYGKLLITAYNVARQRAQS